ncbi:MAG: hypothetical protein ABSC76_18095 [Terracidiphilus sp.]|jgi:hypothetical protein
MTDYAKLADIAKLKDIVDRSVVAKHKELRAEPCTFFQRVTAHLFEEMNKVNVELRKRKAPIFDRIHLPSLDDEILLTYGTDSLCRVGRGIMKGGCRITAVISGPPNGYEISRREYLCKQEESCREVLAVEGSQLRTIAFGPEEVAADIIGGVLAGKFN